MSATPIRFSDAGATAGPTVGGQTLTLRVTQSSGGDLTVWSAQSFQDTWFGLAREVVVALVIERESLAFQLSYAKGLIERDDFRACISRYLWDPRSVPGLERKALMLTELVPDLVNAELVSTVFHCELVDAERALETAAKQMRFSFAGPLDSVRHLLTERMRGTR